jgi:hypothetical protein
VAPGQVISGAKRRSSFKVSAGSVEIKDGKDGQLVLAGSAVFRAMKSRSEPEKRSGRQPESKTPEQWKIKESPEQMEKQRQATGATVKQRYWRLMRDLFRR